MKRKPSIIGSFVLAIFFTAHFFKERKEKRDYVEKLENENIKLKEKLRGKHV